MDEFYFCITFLVDTILLSPSLKLTVFAHTPIYIVGQYLHAKYVIEPGDTDSMVMKGSLSAILFFTLFGIYYLVTV